MKNALAIVALTSGLSIAARAESPPAVPESLLACAKLQDSAERVRCYDAQVAAMQQAGKGAAAAAPAPTAARAPAPVPVPPNPASTAAPVNAATPAARTAETNAGSAAPRSAQSAPEPAPAASPSAPAGSAAAHFGEEQLPFAQSPKRRHDKETLSSSITGVTKGPPGIYYFSLANGQVWRGEGSEIANSSAIGFLFRAGVPVRIERGALGSYHMSAPDIGTKNWMYVRRVR